MFVDTSQLLNVGCAKSAPRTLLSTLVVLESVAKIPNEVKNSSVPHALETVNNIELECNVGVRELWQGPMYLSTADIALEPQAMASCPVSPPQWDQFEAAQHQDVR